MVDRLRTVIFAIGASVTIGLSSCGDPGNTDPSDTETSEAAAEVRQQWTEAADPPATNATATAVADDVATNPPGDACGASKVAAFVSQKATAEVKAKVATEVGHGTIRWVGPDTAVTQDYSPQRLNVAIDAGDVITGGSCG